VVPPRPSVVRPGGRKMRLCLADGRERLGRTRAPARPDSTAEATISGLDRLPRVWAEAREPRLQGSLSRLLGHQRHPFHL